MKLDELTRQQTAEAEKKKLEQELTAQLSSNQPPASAQAPTSSSQPFSSGWSADQPLTVARAGSAYLNLSFDALMNVGFGLSTVAGMTVGGAMVAAAGPEAGLYLDAATFAAEWRGVEDRELQPLRRVGQGRRVAGFVHPGLKVHRLGGADAEDHA